MKWLEFVKQYRGDHPHLSYKETLKACKGDWAKHKAKKDYCPKLRPKKKETEPKGKCKMSKKLRESVKEQCGIQKPRPLTPKKSKRRKTTSSSSKPQMEGSVKPKATRKRKRSQVST